MSDPQHPEDLPDYMQPILPHEEGVTEGAVVSIIDQAEINQQIATAKRYPRSATVFRKKLYQMVTIDTETAESCIYALPRDGKMIDGPSIRFAELLLVAWGNARAADEVTHVDEEFITAQGVFFDLETNVAISGKVMRRITGKPTPQHPKGKRFNQDMIVVTGNAARSIALRNAILRGVPKVLWKSIWDEAKKVAAGDAKTFTTRRDQVMKELGIQGATPDMIFALLGVKGVDDMTTEHLVHLRGVQNAIKDNETTFEEAFKVVLKPGEVAPPQPKQSDFSRETTPATGEAKPAAAKTAAPKADPPKPAETAQTPSQEPQKPAQETAVAGAQEDGFEAWYSFQKAAVPNCTKMRELVDLRDATLPQLEGFPDKEKEFTGLYDTRMKEILNASKKPGK